MAVNDQNSLVRQTAVSALGTIGSSNNEVITALKSALEDDAPGVRQAAVMAVQKTGIRDSDILIRLGILVGDQDISVALNAKNALVSMDALGDVIQLMVESLTEECWQEDIISSFGRLGAFGAEFVPGIVQYLTNSDESLRVIAIQALEHLCSHSMVALPFITERLLDPSFKVRRAALNAVESIGTFNEDIIRELVEQLYTGDAILRWEATRNLFRHGMSYDNILTDKVIDQMNYTMDGLDLIFINKHLVDFQLPAWPKDVPDATIIVKPGDDIQAAIDQLAECGGGIVHLLEGKHEIENTIILRSKIVLSGVGPRTIITRKPDARVDCMVFGEGGLVDITIRDLTIDGNRSRKERNWIWQEDSQTPWPTGLFILDDNGKSNQRVLISGVTITRTAMGLHSKGTHDLIITDTKVYDNGGVDYYFHNGYLRRNQRVVVKNSVFADSHTGNGLNLTMQENIVVQHNVFLNNGFRGVRAANSRNIVIRDNVASFNQDFGIGTRSEDGGVTNYLIYNNYANANNVNYSIMSAANGRSIDNISISK